MKAFWHGYVHLTGPDQDTVIEYFNMSAHPQTIRVSFLSREATPLPNQDAQIYRLGPRQVMQVSARSAIAKADLEEFQGQCVAEFENSLSQWDVIPAVTTYWRSATHHCEVATHAISHLNEGRPKVFFMFCPVVWNADFSTKVILFNTSTSPNYVDEAVVTPVLRSIDGQKLLGKECRANPFGMLAVDLVDCFGEDGRRLLAGAGGYGSLCMTHPTRSFPSYFFQIASGTNRIVSGQHSQPPSYAIGRSGIWWGKLRRYSPWL